MPEKLFRGTKRKIAPKTETKAEPDVVLVGTYKEKQLAWIKKNGVYNYPVKDGDELTDEACGKVKELWLYSDVKSTRHAFAAQFVSKMSRDEFVAAYPSYAKLGKSKNKAYYVFKTTPHDYGPAADGQLVVARAADFGGRSAKVKKAVEQFKADGEFAPLAAYLPSDLAKVPRQQLRVCDGGVQLDFIQTMYPEDESTRLLPSNGLCLAATYDAAFDRHLISFDEECRMILSPSLHEYLTNDSFAHVFKCYEGKRIAQAVKFQPSQEFLQRHREQMS